MSNTDPNVPVLIEAAITPFRPNAPVENGSGMAREANESIAAGAAIVHHHHDFRLNARDSIEEMLDMGQRILAENPAAILYPDYIKGDSVEERTVHLDPLAKAGLLGFAPLDPGAGFSGQLDDAGLPVGANSVRQSFDEANLIALMAEKVNVPMTIGVFEPGQLRWALAYKEAGRLPQGSMVKLYFGGRYSLVRPGKKALNFGLPPTAEAVDAYVSMLQGTGIPWSVGVMGDILLETPVARRALERGGHLRVGIEDIAGLNDMTNAESVAAAVELAKQVGREVADPATGRDILGLPQRVTR